MNTLFALRADTSAVVRFVDVFIQPSYHHFVRHPSGGRWSVPDCTGEGCRYCYHGEKIFKRWPITLITEDFRVVTWQMPTVVAGMVDQHLRDFGVDLFLVTDFHVARSGHGMNTVYSVTPMWGAA